MKISALTILLFFQITAYGQTQVTAEQIFYLNAGGEFSIGPVVSLQNKKNWYTEIRYNYEEFKTFSLYVGHAFDRESTFSYSIVPIFGGVIGRYKGWSAALNIDLEYKGLFFSSQSQYTFAPKDEVQNFFFSWSELGYQPLDWFYAGAAIQPTYYPHTKDRSLSPGYLVGFVFGKWTIPLYAFSPFNSDRAFICSVIKVWGD